MRIHLLDFAIAFIANIFFTVTAWERLQDKFYRNIEGFYLQWNNLNIEDYIIASAPYGGAIGKTYHSSHVSFVIN